MEQQNKQKRNKKIFIIIVTCISIILIELLIMLIVHISRERKINHIDSLNNIIKTNNGYIGVGISDFNDSIFVSKKTYEYTDDVTKKKQNVIATQSKLVKYDNRFNIIWEKTFDNDYDSTFYDIIEVNDGYIVVGSYAKDDKQISLNTRDALIIKYDYNGNIIWKNTYSVLSDTEFYKVIQDDNNLVVIGQSIYENMELGNHITGGGIIVKYNKDNGELLESNNYGGNKSGKFNDIIKVDDGYIVCGKDATNYGIIVKFKKNFNREENDNNLISKKIMWQRTYSNTDYEGFTSIVKDNDILYLGGAINISTEKDKEGNPIFKYDAGIVLYNTKSKYLGSYSLKNNIHNRINSMIIDNNYLYVNFLLNIDEKDQNKTSMLNKYNIKEIDKLDKFIYSKTFDNQNNYIINKLTKIDNDILYIGTTNKECKLFTGCDYHIIIEKYQEN